MKTTHTLGPWEVGSHKGQLTIFDSRGNKTIPIATIHSIVIEGSEGNAHLMAASPDMLEALEEIVEKIVKYSCLERNSIDTTKALAAIKKAEGEH